MIPLLIAAIVSLTNEFGTVDVDTFGANILSYVPAGGREMFFRQSEDYRTNQWYHGGVPVCWPWFGRIGKGDENIHGYAWKKQFSVKSRSDSAVTLELKTGFADLEYTIRLGAALELELKTFNGSDCDFPMGVAFHP